MKEKILQRLKEIEQTYGVKIIYAVESGSRMWGFSSPDSDYDVRFIYVSKPQAYLTVKERPDYIEFMDKTLDLDFAGWDIKKALYLLNKSNMSLYEWLNSPAVYITTPQAEEFKKLAQNFWDNKKLIYSYIHLAQGNYNKYILGRTPVKLKKYLYILRTIAACIYIEKHRTVPPITAEELLPAVKQDDVYVSGFFEKIIKAKKAGEELSEQHPDTAVNKWIEDKLTYYKNFAADIPVEKKDLSPLDAFLYKTVMKN